MSARTLDHSAMAEINITPLVDVMLVLLIIFMIAAPVLAHRIPLDLPQANPKPQPLPPPTVMLSVHADGTLYWNDEPFVGAALEAQLRAEARREPQPELVIDAARDAQYQVVATVLASANGAGLRRIGFKP